MARSNTLSPLREVARSHLLLIHSAIGHAVEVACQGSQSREEDGGGVSIIELGSPPQLKQQIEKPGSPFQSLATDKVTTRKRDCSEFGSGPGLNQNLNVAFSLESSRCPKDSS